jgi:dihydropteroate synthase
MPTIRRYIRPIASMPPSAPGRAGEAAAIVVAGREDLPFAAAEVIERDGGRVSRRIASAAEVLSGQMGGLTALLENLSSPRAAIAGLALDRPRIMGIVNVTPDSFADGGRYLTRDAAVAHALQLEAEGADILDIGGESTRPGAEPVDVEEEWRRVGPVIAALAPRTRARLSIDTRNAEVMRRGAAAGVHLINDVSALSHDPASLETVARSGLPVVLMHARGDPRTMQQKPTYADVVLDVCDALEARIEACVAAGIPRSRLIVDPGIGFGKTLSHNLALLGALSLLHGLGSAVLLGASRKSFIGRLTGGSQADDRLPGSLAAALIGAAQGVQILRVHDVAATRQALAVWEGARRAASPA